MQNISIKYIIALILTLLSVLLEVEAVEDRHLSCGSKVDRFVENCRQCGFYCRGDCKIKKQIRIKRKNNSSWMKKKQKSWICVKREGIKNGHKYETPRLLKLKIYLDDSKVEEYKKMYGRNYKEEATSEMKQLLKSASKLLRQLDNDGFELKLDGPLVVLSESPLMVGKTYFDRADYNKEKPLDVNHEDFTLGMAFALQDRIKSIKDFQHLPDTLIFLITSFKKGRILEAATEENCICASPPDFPCIGIWANDDMSKGALLAHEVAHALGAELHDPKWSNTIMADAVHSWFTDWSQFSKDQINRQDNTCLNKVEREKLILENSMNEDEYESDRRSGAIQMENINKNPRKNVRDCIPPCRQPE